MLLAALPAMLTHGALAAGAGLNLVFDGDSISAGMGAPPGHGLDAQVVAGLADQVQMRNVAAGGRPVLNCLQFYGQRVAPLYSPEARANVIVFHAGDNDIAQGRDAVRTYAAFRDYVDVAHRQGWKLVVSTELRRFGFTPANQAQLEAYNTRLRQNQARADAVVDLDTDPRFVDAEQRSNPEVFAADGVHLSESGYALMAAMLVPVIKRVGSTR